MDLRRLISIARKWLLLLIASTVIAAIGAYLVSGLLPRVYQAEATLNVGQSLSAVNPDYTQLLVSQRLSTTYATVATTRPVLEAVIGKLGLTDSADALAGRVRASAAVDSTLLSITAEDKDPVRAAAIANALADQLIAASPTIQGRRTELQQTIDAQLQATAAQIASTQAEVESVGSLASPKPADVTTLETLQARLASLRATYASLLAFASSNAANLVTVVEPAVPPIAPVAPRPLLNGIIAAVIGLLFAGVIVGLVEYLDDSLKTSEDVRLVTDLPTLGSIARMKGDGKRSEMYRLATLLYPRSAAAEAYRVLRSNIEFSSVDKELRTLLVTSATPGEGKTVTAANIAVAFAQAGRRVLLVDADLRKPGQHLVFNLPNGHGLTTMLRNEGVSLDSVANMPEQANLRILTTGPLPPNPAELLGSHRMRAVLTRLREGVDIAIFDSPPLLAVTDPSILSSFVDGTLLVIDARRSHRGAVRQSREALAKAGATVFGVVLNGLPVRRFADQYGDAYGTTLTQEDAANGDRKSAAV